MKSTVGVITLLGLLMLVSVPVYALTERPTPSGGPETAEDFLALAKAISTWVFAFFIVVAIIMILWAAFDFVTAGGDPGKAGAARQRLIFAAVGIVVAILAWSIPAILANILGVTLPR